MSADKFGVWGVYGHAVVPKGKKIVEDIFKMNTDDKASLEANGKHVSMTFCLFSLFIHWTLCHQVHSRNRTARFQVSFGVLLWLRV